MTHMKLRELAAYDESHAVGYKQLKLPVSRQNFLLKQTHKKEKKAKEHNMIWFDLTPNTNHKNKKRPTLHFKWSQIFHHKKNGKGLAKSEKK